MQNNENTVATACDVVWRRTFRVPYTPVIISKSLKATKNVSNPETTTQETAVDDLPLDFKVCNVKM
jgi:hypothetical protein